MGEMKVITVEVNFRPELNILRAAIGPVEIEAEALHNPIVSWEAYLQPPRR